MMRPAEIAFFVAVLSCLACEEKKTESAVDAAPSATATPSASAAATASAAPTMTASAAASASASSSAAPTKEAEVSVPDPEKEPARTVKVLAGGSVNLYLPKWAGTTWSVASADKALGKPKEETIPGFAGPTTPAAKFAWKLDQAKAGQSYKIQLTNKDKAGASKTFTLTLEVS